MRWTVNYTALVAPQSGVAVAYRSLFFAPDTLAIEERRGDWRFEAFLVCCLAAERAGARDERPARRCGLVYS